MYSSGSSPFSLGGLSGLELRLPAGDRQCLPGFGLRASTDHSRSIELQRDKARRESGPTLVRWPFRDFVDGRLALYRPSCLSLLTVLTHYRS